MERESVVDLGVFFFNFTAPTEIYTLSLHDALPILAGWRVHQPQARIGRLGRGGGPATGRPHRRASPGPDRKSTRLNSSHVKISYAVFCLKKKKKFQDLRHTAVILICDFSAMIADPT